MKTYYYVVKYYYKGMKGLSDGHKRFGNGETGDVVNFCNEVKKQGGEYEIFYWSVEPVTWSIGKLG